MRWCKCEGGGDNAVTSSSKRKLSLGEVVILSPEYPITLVSMLGWAWGEGGKCFTRIPP